MRSKLLSETDLKNVKHGLGEIYFPAWDSRIDQALYVLVRDFGIPIQLIADKVGTKRPNVSMWIHGSRPIPEKYKKIVDQILRETIDAAKELLEQKKKIYGMFTNKDQSSQYIDTDFSFENQIKTLEWKIVRAETVYIFG